MEFRLAHQTESSKAQETGLETVPAMAKEKVLQKVRQRVLGMVELMARAKDRERDYQKVRETDLETAQAKAPEKAQETVR